AACRAPHGRAPAAGRFPPLPPSAALSPAADRARGHLCAARGARSHRSTHRRGRTSSRSGQGSVSCPGAYRDSAAGGITCVCPSSGAARGKGRAGTALPVSRWGPNEPAMHDRALERVAADDAGIARAAELLRAGALVAVPTATVYRLAALADRAESIAAIYRAKGRPDFNPLIVHVATLAQARTLAQFDSRAEALAARYWPGPLTLVLPLAPGSTVVPAVTA